MPIYLSKTKGCADDLLIYSPSLPPKPILIKGRYHEYDEFSNVMTIEELNQYISIRIIDEIEHNTFLLEDGTIIKPSKKTPGVKLLSRCFKTTPSIIYRLRRKGYSWMNIIQHYQTLHTQNSPHKVKHNGVYYKNLRTLCNALNIDLDKLRNYRQKHPNESLEQQINSVRELDRTVTDHLGNIYSSKSEMCRYYNITSSAFSHRMLNNWSLEKTLTTPISQTKPTQRIAPTVDHKGVGYDSFAQMCQSYGISPGVVRARLKYGNDLETALTKPLRAKSNLYETMYHGQSYRSVDEILTKHSITRSLYNKRKHQYPKQTLEEIIDGILKDRNT